MTFQEFIETITEAERDYVSRLDYGQDAEAHRAALDVVLNNGGVIETESQGVWHPLEVVELGRNALVEGHEREFVLCVGITLLTGSVGDEAEQILDYHMQDLASLPQDLRTMLEEMVTEAIEGCEPEAGPIRQ